MPRHFAIALAAVLALVSPGRAQETLDPAQLAEAADWVAENIDDSVLDALGVDADRTREFLTELQKEFQGEYVLDLAELRGTAAQLLPLLQRYEETQPYAAWLQAHLDYFEVAERLRKQAGTNATTTARKPSPAVERSVWVSVVETRPNPRVPSNTLARLKQVFRDERVPEELVWVAEVESSFNPRARSPVGAAGLYQLMPVTARSAGLSVGLLRDDRFDGEKNARAAARYLKRLHNRFGDWHLALAAYNGGESRVAELLRKRKAKSFDAIATSLPAETQMFVPKVETTIRKREGRALEQLKVA